MQRHTHAYSWLLVALTFQHQPFDQDCMQANVDADDGQDMLIY